MSLSGRAFRLKEREKVFNYNDDLASILKHPIKGLFQTSKHYEKSKGYIC